FVLGGGVVHDDDVGIGKELLHAFSGTSSKRSTSTRPASVILRLGITESARKASCWNGDSSVQPSFAAASMQPRLAATTSSSGDSERRPAIGSASSARTPPSSTTTTPPPIAGRRRPARANTTSP